MLRYAWPTRAHLAAVAASAMASLTIGCSSSQDTWTPPAGQPDGGADGSSKDGSTGCIPRTCASAQAECGAAPDGCGGTLACGPCAAGSFCGGNGPNRCGSNPCEPLTCQDPSHPCGVLSDGCAETINCGSCKTPETCGGGGLPNRCGCSSSSCAAQGAQCGTIDDGCGLALNCGECPSGQLCGIESANHCTDCGMPGKSCCAGTVCISGYCYEGTCYEDPWSTEEFGDGAGCGDIGAEHQAPAFLLRSTVHGRPNAIAKRYCIHTSCPGAKAFETTDSPYLLDATGVHVVEITNAPIPDCLFENLGAWECWFEVDGKLSNHAGGTVFNSLCSETATCGLGSQFCPPGG